ncbi:MAG TPA: MFS transporter [Actinomycetota bacterium]|jgi:MFS family permease|nr:MFS transporter [Actinomycetota bacterium]
MSDGARERRFRAALSHRDYRSLLGSLAVSETGSWLYAAATIIYILDATGSAAWVGVAAVVRLLPYVLFEPFGGAIADRYDRRRVMIVCDLARAGLMGVMAVVAISTSTVAVVVVIALTFVNNTLTSPYYPCVTAITPSIVPERDLAAANALSGTIDNFALAFGPALSAVLLLLGPPPVAIALNGVTFLVSALLVARMRTRGRIGEVETESSLVERIGHGAKAIRGSKEAILLIGLAFAFGLTFGQEVVLYGPLAEDSLGLGIDATGLLFAAPGIGGLLVAALAARLAARSHTAGVLALSTFLGGIPLTLLSFIHDPVVAFALLTFEGAAVIVSDVVTTTTLQRVVPNDKVGSAFGILGGVSVIGMVLGSLLAPLMIEVFGLSVATAFAGGVLLAVTLVVLPRARAMDRTAAARAIELAPTVDLLERLGIFEGTTPQQLEALAAVTREERVPVGSVVIREGDEPDDLFAIADGTLEVRTGTGAAEHMVASLGAGDYVGEIGLLEKRPRTATVVAVEPARLLRIPGEDFLRIVNDAPRISPTLISVVASRLAASQPEDDHEQMGRS